MNISSKMLCSHLLIVFWMQQYGRAVTTYVCPYQDANGNLLNALDHFYSESNHAFTYQLS